MFLTLKSCTVILCLSQFLQGKRLQGFNVITSAEHVGNMNYDMSSEEVTRLRITTNLGVMSLCNTRNSVKIKKFSRQVTFDTADVLLSF